MSENKPLPTPEELAREMAEARDAPTGDEPTRCGFVAIIGAPNAGKSTLVNALVGQKVAITSPKAQTTRARMMGIAMFGASQMILIDTPGIFAPRRKLDRAMVHAAWEGARSADVIALIVDSARPRDKELSDLLDALARRPERKMLVLNKVDLVKKDRLLELAAALGEKVDFDEVFFIAALTGDGVLEFKQALAEAMPEEPWHYPPDQIADISERLLAAEVTREQLYRQLREELPYESTVLPERYRQREDGSVEIHQQIVVSRENHRAIVLGKGGQRIKSIGAEARKELSRLLGRKVHLFLHVKVNPRWAEDKDIYEEIGLEWIG